MKRSSTQHSRIAIAKELADIKFVNLYEITAPQIQYKEAISEFLFLQLYVETSRDEIFSKKIFSRN